MAEYVYDNRRRKWLDLDTGLPLSTDAVVAEMRLHQEASRDLLRALTEQLYSGQISLEQWQVAVASLLKEMHLAQAVFGAGGKFNLDDAARRQVQDTLETQFRFLRDFVVAIVAGMSLAAAVSRVLMYASATQQSFWQALAGGQKKNVKIYWTLHPAEHCNGCLALAAGSPYTADTLPTYPGAGDTECLTNCVCTLEVL